MCIKKNKTIRRNLSEWTILKWDEYENTSKSKIARLNSKNKKYIMGTLLDDMLDDMLIREYF